MPIDQASGVIRWRIHFRSSPSAVYEMLATDEGRAKFWAESAIERDDVIDFQFPNGFQWQGRILDRRPDEHYAVDYFSARVTFDLANDGAGGTDLTLTDSGEMSEDRHQVYAGWISVLMTMKAAADYGVDLRNHDPSRSWDDGYADN